MLQHALVHLVHFQRVSSLFEQQLRVVETMRAESDANKITCHAFQSRLGESVKEDTLKFPKHCLVKCSIYVWFRRQLCLLDQLPLLAALHASPGEEGNWVILVLQQKHALHLLILCRQTLG